MATTTAPPQVAIHGDNSASSSGVVIDEASVDSTMLDATAPYSTWNCEAIR